MKEITIQITGNQATVTQNPAVVAGSVGLPVAFMFDESWDGLEKTVLFRVGEQVYQVLSPGQTVAIPWELLTQPGVTLWAGAWGSSPDGTVQIPTIWVSLGQILPGTQPAGEETKDPTAPVWQQVYEVLWEKAAEAVEQATPNIVSAVLAAMPDGDGVSY